MVTFQALEMTLKGGIVALDSYLGQLPDFQKTRHNVCTFSKSQFPYSRISENSLEARAPGSNFKLTLLLLYANRVNDVIWCKDCGFVGYCINNLDLSHYITNIHNTVMSLQILSVLIVVCSVVILNILRHSTAMHLVGLV